MTVSREAVTWAYRLMLGREPESDQVISEFMTVSDFAQLSSIFLSSPEFAAKHGQRMVSLPIALEPTTIDFAADKSEMAACLKKVKEAWVHLGIIRPHFSVITDHKFLPESLDANIDSFWASGDGEAENVIRILARHGYGAVADMSCVEYGCGVGRVTMPLARRFLRVDAYDISSGHLKQAERRAKQIGIENVSFRECGAKVLPDLEMCDFFYSCIVLQHNPPPIIVELIRRALNSLKPGGVALFQVPTYIAGYRFQLKEWLSAEHVLDMQMHCLPQHAIFNVVKEQGCVVLEVREDGSCGEPHKYLSNLFAVHKPLSATAGRRFRPWY